MRRRSFFSGLKPLLVDRFGKSVELPFATTKEVWIGVLAGAAHTVSGSAASPGLLFGSGQSASADHGPEFNTIWCDGKTRLRFEFYSAWSENSSGGADVNLGFYEDGVRFAMCRLYHSTQASSYPMPLIAYRTPAPGLHTYEVKTWKTAGTAQIVLSGGEPRTHLRISRGSGQPVFDRDPQFAQVVGLYNFEAANGTTVYTDQSNYGNTFSGGGSGLAISTAQSKFGTSSFSGNGTGTPPPAVTSSAWVFGTNQFTIEWWVRTGSSGSVISWMDEGIATNLGFMIYQTDGTAFQIRDAWNANIRSFTGGTDNGGWNFFTLNKVAGSAWFGSCNGAALTQANALGDGVPGTRDFATGNIARLGNFYKTTTNAVQFNGYLGPLRITNCINGIGTARYTAAHGVPNAPFPIG